MKKARTIERGIYQRGKYSFQVRLMVDGHSISGTFDTLDEARAYRDSKRARLALDPDAARVHASRAARHEVKAATLDKMLEKYAKEVSSAKKSPESELYRIGQIRRSNIAGKSLYRITAEDIRDYLTSLRCEQRGHRQGDPVSESTKRKHAALLSHLFSIARKRWQMDIGNPVKDIELPVSGRSRKRRFEGDEEERLLAALAQSRQAAIAVPLVRVAIETGMRQGELLALEWADVKIDGDTGTAFLPDTKNGEIRIVPLEAAACKALKSMARPIKGGRVFPLSQPALRTIWTWALKRADIEGLRFHDLRHEATSRLFELGLDRIEAGSITGHKTLQMLRDYTHLRAENLAKKLNRAKHQQSREKMQQKKK